MKNMMRNIKVMVILISVAWGFCYAPPIIVSTKNSDIKFGSKTSSIVVSDDAEFDIATPRSMVINGGSLVNTGFGKIEGQNIRFNRGAYTFFNSISDLNGSLSPASNIISLDFDPADAGGTMIANPGGLARVQVFAKPGLNLMRGQPLFFGAQDLTLQNNTTGLAVAVQNTVNTNIRLNGGVLFLQDDLRLGDDSVILDSGTVIFNNRRLSLGGKASNWNGRIIWDASLDLQINSAITLNGEWIFFGEEGQINGNGNVIDIANGGSIVVLEGSLLRMAGVHIKGLGALGSIKLAKDATLVLSDVVIEMEADYNFDSGTILVEGNSTIITKNYILSFIDGPDGAVGKLIVDRVALTYDTLASIDQLNIRPPLIQDPMRNHIEIIDQGEIRTIRSDTVTFHNYRSEPLLQKYAIVAPYRKFEVFPEVNNMNFNFNVVIDGNTNFLGFTRTDEGIFIITDGVQATTQNITMRDLSPKHVVFKPGSSLTFGDKTTISFARNETLDYKWVFEGSTILKGAGNILELGPNGEIEVRGPNATLLLDGITIKGITGNKIRCLQNSSRIILKNVKWIQSGNAVYRNGGISVLDDSAMSGGFGFAFNYLSTEPFNILSNATFSLVRDMVFNLAPTNNATNILQPADASAVLLLDQATLGATPGQTIAAGRVVVRNRNFVQGSVTFGPGVILDKPSGATLEQI